MYGMYSRRTERRLRIWRLILKCLIKLENQLASFFVLEEKEGNDASDHVHVVYTQNGCRE
ncbi:hypothetical protein PAT3040_05382 [Paenibacillus agaridevorans]|uniref:Uncharacterized protein n=1 Tax=Paenibacillus agaridevorans TaxID=171404 RepID=A0A2R5F3M5_9BACL|nr:hypothetical protein PAT3040_05382 [Paenibacillus agaridevorans]